MRKTCTKGRKYLIKRQQEVIDDLFNSGLDEAAVLAKHGVRRIVFRKWLSEKVFADEIRFRIECAQRQSRLIIAKYAPLAAAKLVQLTESDKEETARRACLDVISLPSASRARKNSKSDPDPSGEAGDDAARGEIPSLSPEVASRLLGALAEEKRK